MPYTKKEADVITILGVVVEAMRKAKKGHQIYEWPLKDDPDDIFEAANRMLAERHALPDSHKDHIADDFVLLTPALYTGKMCIVQKDGEVNPAVEKMVREQLGLIAHQRGGKLRGRNIAEIGKLKPQDLEEFRKQVCSQRSGGVQFENHCLFWIGSGKDRWMHRNLQKTFPNIKAIYKVPGRNRVYAFQFAGGKISEAMRDAKDRLKTLAKADAEEKQEREKKALAKRKPKTKAVAKKKATRKGRAKSRKQEPVGAPVA
ncbi:MAG: hypothetical protein ACW99U_12950 [Candidatus Thorarchaeota archaeon]